MASVRKQQNGRWQGVAVHPSGRRYTKVWALKKQALLWAQEQENEWRRGVGFDPRAGEQLVREWVAEWTAARVVDPVTSDKEASHLRTHITPKWGNWPLGSVRRLDVQAWVKEMELAGHGAHTITGAARVFSTLMRAAADEGRITANPCTRVSLPTPPAKAPFFWTKAQAALILAELDEPWRTACDLSFHTGLRLGEMLGLRAGAVDWASGLIHVTGVMTRRGWRAHPKSKRSRRTVPVPDHLLDALAPLVVGRDTDATVFPAGRGRPMSDVNFRNRIFDPAVQRAGVPRGTPHDMRHTAASWLVQSGVDLYRVQALLGHESQTTTLKYSHHAPDAHDRIRQAWTRIGDASTRSGTDDTSDTRSPG